MAGVLGWARPKRSKKPWRARWGLRTDAAPLREVRRLSGARDVEYYLAAAAFCWRYLNPTLSWRLFQWLGLRPKAWMFRPLSWLA